MSGIIYLSALLLTSVRTKEQDCLKERLAQAQDALLEVTTQKKDRKKEIVTRRKRLMEVQDSLTDIFLQLAEALRFMIAYYDSESAQQRKEQIDHIIQTGSLSDCSDAVKDTIVKLVWLDYKKPSTMKELEEKIKEGNTAVEKMESDNQMIRQEIEGRKESLCLLESQVKKEMDKLRSLEEAEMALRNELCCRKSAECGTIYKEREEIEQSGNVSQTTTAEGR